MASVKGEVCSCLVFLFCFYLRNFCDRKCQIYAEIRAFAKHTVNDDLTAHQMDQTVCNRHTKTGSTVLFGDILAFLFKRLENTADKFSIHTFSCIMNTEHQAYFAIFFLKLAECNTDLSFFCKLLGIG